MGNCTGSTGGNIGWVEYSTCTAPPRGYVPKTRSQIFLDQLRLPPTKTGQCPHSDSDLRPNNQEEKNWIDCCIGLVAVQTSIFREIHHDEGNRGFFEYFNNILLTSTEINWFKLFRELIFAYDHTNDINLKEMDNVDDGTSGCFIEGKRILSEAALRKTTSDCCFRCFYIANQNKWRWASGTTGNMWSSFHECFVGCAAIDVDKKFTLTHVALLCHNLRVLEKQSLLKGLGMSHESLIRAALLVSRIPTGWQVAHLCGNGTKFPCMNPDHLAIVPDVVNSVFHEYAHFALRRAELYYVMYLQHITKHGLLPDDEIANLYEIVYAMVHNGSLELTGLF